jgi:hypothetical protein
LAADHPDRVLGAVASGTNLPLAPGHDRPEAGSFLEPYRSTEGWAKFNADYWRTALCGLPHEPAEPALAEVDPRGVLRLIGTALLRVW